MTIGEAFRVVEIEGLKAEVEHWKTQCKGILDAFDAEVKDRKKAEAKVEQLQAQITPTNQLRFKLERIDELIDFVYVQANGINGFDVVGWNKRADLLYILNELKYTQRKTKRVSKKQATLDRHVADRLEGD